MRSRWRDLPVYGMVALTLWGLLLLANAEAAEIEPMVTYVHQSDIRRGAPFNNEQEWHTDFIGAGGTISIGRRSRFELDLAHGAKRYSAGPWEHGTVLALRFYPRRK